MCLFVCLFTGTGLQDVLLQEGPAAVVLRSFPALLSGAALWTADRCPEQQNVSLHLFLHFPAFRLSFVQNLSRAEKVE